MIDWRRHLNVTPFPSPKQRRGRPLDIETAADDGQDGRGEALAYGVLTEREMTFIGQRDSFYLASVSESGWPDIRRHCGAPGFVRAQGTKTLSFLDFTEPQTLSASAGVTADSRVALIFMDYAKSRGLEVVGRLTSVSLEDAPNLPVELFGPDAKAGTARVGSIRIEMVDWRHQPDLTRRYTARELEPLTRRVAALEARNATLRAQIAALTNPRT